jgi:hypothetical protein
MSFRPKATDWRRLPTEVRELLLQALESRAALELWPKMTAVELAAACGFPDLDPWQHGVLTSYSKQVAMLCSRQSGKSTVSSLLALYEALYVAGSLTLVVAPSQRQSMETFRKIRDSYNALAGIPAPVMESSLRLELSNGSRVVVLPAKEANVRGFSGVDLLICDEASRIPDDLYNALRPTMAVSNGRIVLLSTPFGSRGFFHKEWTEGDGWQRFKVTATECPRIADTWLEKEKARIGSWWFSQEYECSFNDNVDQIFSTADINAAVDENIEPLWGGVKHVNQTSELAPGILVGA